jgi:hypothetical protein
MRRGPLEVAASLSLRARGAAPDGAWDTGFIPVDTSEAA